MRCEGCHPSIPLTQPHSFLLASPPLSLLVPRGLPALPVISLCSLLASVSALSVTLLDLSTVQLPSVASMSQLSLLMESDVEKEMKMRCTAMDKDASGVLSLSQLREVMQRMGEDVGRCGCGGDGATRRGV